MPIKKKKGGPKCLTPFFLIFIGYDNRAVEIFQCLSARSHGFDSDCRLTNFCIFSKFFSFKKIHLNKFIPKHFLNCVIVIIFLQIMNFLKKEKISFNFKKAGIGDLG